MTSAPHRSSVRQQIKRYPVRNSRNSSCTNDLELLDWSNWWTDGVDRLYLHVQSSVDDSVQRVYCRKSDTPRLAMQDGELVWLVDPKGGLA